MKAPNNLTQPNRLGLSYLLNVNSPFEKQSEDCSVLDPSPPVVGQAMILEPNM